MPTPDLTPDQADVLRAQRRTLPGLAMVLGSVLAFLAAVIVLGAYLERRFFVPAYAISLVAVGLAWGLLTITKPSLYWSSDAVLVARVRTSAQDITRSTLFVAALFLGLGLVGIFW